MVETPCVSDEIVMWSMLESVERSIRKQEKGCGWVNGWVDKTLQSAIARIVVTCSYRTLYHPGHSLSTTCRLTACVILYSYPAQEKAAAMLNFFFWPLLPLLLARPVQKCIFFPPFLLPFFLLALKQKDLERLKAKKDLTREQRLDHCKCSLVGDGKTVALALNKIPVLYILAEVPCNLNHIPKHEIAVVWEGGESESE